MVVRGVRGGKPQSQCCLRMALPAGPNEPLPASFCRWRTIIIIINRVKHIVKHMLELFVEDMFKHRFKQCVKVFCMLEAMFKAF